MTGPAGLLAATIGIPGQATGEKGIAKHSELPGQDESSKIKGRTKPGGANQGHTKNGIRHWVSELTCSSLPVVTGVHALKHNHELAAVGIFLSPVVTGISRCCGATAVVTGNHPLLRGSECLPR